MALDPEAVPSWLMAEISQDKIFADKYQVENELGFGAAGVVVGARHRVLDQRVAIKFLRSGQESPDAVARFIREARAASRIRNQHVVRVIDASTLSSGMPFLVMEYLEGVDLERMLHQSPHRQLPIKDAIDLILQTCEALAECHCAGIVHRDLKPSNLFCVHGTDGLPMIKVLDFGIAKLGTTTIEADLPEGAVGGAPQRRLLGSPAYMSPEQFESSSHVDLRSDIWAIGVILYEFITGELPFQETSIYRIRKRVAEDSPRPIRELRRDAPANLWPVILKCIEKVADLRYSNLADLAKALMPFASTRGRQSVARIVRTVEAPGSDTASLSLQPASGGRSSMTPIAHTVRAGRTRRASTLLGLGLILVTSVSVVWFNARRVRQTAAAAPSLRAAPMTTNVVALVDSTPPLIATSVRRAEEPSAQPVIVHAPPQRPPNQTYARPSSSGSGAPDRPGPAEPGSNAGASHAPDAAASATSQPSTSASPPSPEPSGAPAPTQWAFPIIEHRKHSQ